MSFAGKPWDGTRVAVPAPLPIGRGEFYLYPATKTYLVEVCNLNAEDRHVQVSLGRGNDPSNYSPAALRLLAEFFDELATQQGA